MIKYLNWINSTRISFDIFKSIEIAESTRRQPEYLKSLQKKQKLIKMGFDDMLYEKACRGARFQEPEGCS